ncbi:unnamed protein product, partial [Linum tenue]
SFSDGFKVTGLQLLRLEIRNSRGFSVSQVLAPKLESFCFTTHVSHIVELPELNLPSLDRATVLMVSYPYAGLYNELGWCSRVAVKFLQGLRNVKSLDLYFEDVNCTKKGGGSFTRIKPMIENEISRFTRLKTSRIRYYPCD